MTTSQRVRLKSRTRGGVVFAEVCGLVTLDVVRSIRDDLAPITTGASALLLDYRQSAIALTDADLLELGAQPSASDLPAAWLVSSDEVAEQWRRQALRFALSGRRRIVCLELAEATAWVYHQARLKPASV